MNEVNIYLTFCKQRTGCLEGLLGECRSVGAPAFLGEDTKLDL